MTFDLRATLAGLEIKLLLKSFLVHVFMCSYHSKAVLKVACELESVTLFFHSLFKNVEGD